MKNEQQLKIDAAWETYKVKRDKSSREFYARQRKLYDQFDAQVKKIKAGRVHPGVNVNAKPVVIKAEEEVA